MRRTAPRLFRMLGMICLGLALLVKLGPLCPAIMAATVPAEALGVYDCQMPADIAAPAKPADKPPGHACETPCVAIVADLQQIGAVEPLPPAVIDDPVVATRRGIALLPATPPPRNA